MDVRLAGVGKRFDRDEVLRDVDLELGPGAIIAVIGLNGAGKTTLLRLLAGAIVPSRGRIAWDGSDSIRDDLGLHRRMMFVPDMPLFLERQTVLEHLATVLGAYGRDGVDADAVAAVLGELDILDQHDRPVATLSRGQRHKAACAALILAAPELWLLDEPFASGMDPQGMLALRRHARRAVEAGACVVYTTQIIEIAERFCDRLLVIDRGRIATSFTAADLRAMPAEGPGSLGERLGEFRERR